ncbi:phage tail protein [Helicobacter sp. 12S02232-10]|uniref:phage tail sheath C-terminal domain-containing protein n=1 Tax=Helicobacter sp. 12S02232-10 TaxID=1476197 RepID=UPI000BA73EAA|nr:phage tail sheath C-terminal domain-containing protein [Helicobacter sp. 12S02232-10]PAF49209.1 phage tail protein [Helicobacter sp. 12S02232-10]
MSSKYGINIEIYNQATKAYAINNTRTLAIVGDDANTENVGVKYYPSIDEAIKAVGDGSIQDTLKDLEATGINTTLIISSFVKDTTGVDETEKQKKDIVKAIEAIEALLGAEQTTGLKPKFILSSLYNNDKGVWEKLKIIGDKLGAIYTIEVNETKEEKINECIKDFSAKRAIITYQKVQRLDKTIRPLGNFIIAGYIKVMNQSEYGFAQTFSNRILDGIIGIVDKVEFISGEDCMADRLRGKGITLAIADNGLRSWGGETTDSDFTSIHSVVIFDTIMESIATSQKEAIDKQISDTLKKVVDDLEAFYRRLVGNNIIIGFEVSVPESLNTNESIAQGKIYIGHKAQETPLMKNITNKIYKVDSYGAELIKELN